MKITSIPHVYRNANRWGEILTILSKYGLAGWIGRFDVPIVKGFLKNRDGESLAHLIAGSEPPVDIAGLSGSRFAAGRSFPSVWGPGNRA